MSALTNDIEDFLKAMMAMTADGILEIRRNELAEKFACAPSQINYVLATRFTPYKGYFIESRRGGGGYIKIMKVDFEADDDFNDLLINTIGSSVTQDKGIRIVESLLEEELITKRESELIQAALSDRSLMVQPIETRNILRADLLKNLLLILIKE